MRDPVVLGHYQIVRRIGGGGMGAVYEAVDTRHGKRRVAPEGTPPKSLRGLQLEHRFRQECKIAAQIEHPHVLPVYDYAVDDSRPYIPYIAMRLISRGTDLASEIKSSGRLSITQTVVIIGQVASALDAAHEKGLRHRDVKPSNILLEHSAGNDHACLLAWG